MKEDNQNCFRIWGKQKIRVYWNGGVFWGRLTTVCFYCKKYFLKWKYSTYMSTTSYIVRMEFFRKTLKDHLYPLQSYFIASLYAELSGAQGGHGLSSEGQWPTYREGKLMICGGRFGMLGTVLTALLTSVMLSLCSQQCFFNGSACPRSPFWSICSYDCSLCHTLISCADWGRECVFFWNFTVLW